MNIWLIMSGEPLEMFGERPHRIGIISKMLAKKGHKVTWWTTTYDHQYKEYLYNDDTKLLNNEIEMIFLHSNKKYIKNISFDRINNHKEVSLRFAFISEEKNKPDLIFCAFPTIDLSFEAIKYGKKNNIPVIIDVRDLWPDIFISPFPKILHPLIRIFLIKYVKQTKYIFKNAYAITAVSQKYLEYGLNYGNRKKNIFDKVFPLAYQKIKLDKHTYEEYDQKFKILGIDRNKTILWFVGTFGKTYDLSTVINASNDINDDKVQFILSGDGENSNYWKKLAKDNKNIIFTGWVNINDLVYLSEISNIGLMAYRKGAPQGLPNKIFEYLAAGLPILSSLEGETKKILEEERVGFSYKADDTEDFKKALYKIIKDQVYMDYMSQSCRKLFERKFSAEKVYSDLILHIEKIRKKEANNEICTRDDKKNI